VKNVQKIWIGTRGLGKSRGPSEKGGQGWVLK
jgi:hypothetical protein